MASQLESGTPGATRAHEQRQAIIEEFFQAYHMARQVNAAFAGHLEGQVTHWQLSPPPPACIAALGLPWPCTQQDVKRAFRTRVKTVHPDNGGSSEAFQRLYRAYRDALQLVVN